MSSPDPRPARRTVLVVDFGTTVTNASLLVDGAVRAVPSPVVGARSWSSSAHVGERDIAVGELAEGHRLAAPARYRTEFKRELGRGRTETFGGEKDGWTRQVEPWQLAAALLGKIKEEAEKMVTGPVGRLLVTCPGDYLIGSPDHAAWADLDRACRHVGFVDIEYLREPVAAAYAPVAADPLPPGSLVLVYDFGGGTFDAAVVRIAEEHHQVLAAGSVPDCGGMDIDALLVGELKQLLKDTLGLGAGPSPRVELALVTAARDAKQRLSSDEECVVDLGLLHEGQLITRSKLEDLVTKAKLLDKPLELIKKLLEECGRTEQDLDCILLVGGTTRMPMVARSLPDVPLRRPMDLGCAVVDGAANWARLDTARHAEPDLGGPENLPLRWPIREGFATLSSWLVQPGDQVAAGDPVVRVALPDGPLWDLHSDRPGTLLAQHYRKGQRVHSEDWLATLRTAHPAEAGTTLAPRQWRRIPIEGANHAVINSDGTLVASVKGTEISVYDLVQWRLLGSTSTEQAVEHVAFTPEGRLLLSRAQTLSCWDPRTDVTLWSEVQDFSYIRAAARPDGQLLAVSCDRGNVVQYLDPETGQKLDTHDFSGRGNTSGQAHVTTFSPDGQFLVPASYRIPDGPVDPAADDRPHLQVMDTCHSAVFRPNSTELHFSISSSLRSRALDKPALLTNFGLPANIHALAADPTGGLLAIGLDDGAVQLRRFGPTFATEVAAETKVRGQCLALGFSHDGHRLITVSLQGGIGIWSLTDATPMLR